MSHQFVILWASSYDCRNFAIYSNCLSTHDGFSIAFSFFHWDSFPRFYDFVSIHVCNIFDRSHYLSDRLTFFTMIFSCHFFIILFRCVSSIRLDCTHTHTYLHTVVVEMNQSTYTSPGKYLIQFLLLCVCVSDNRGRRRWNLIIQRVSVVGN